MIALVKAEFRKLFSIRTWWGMAIAITLVSGGFAAIFALIVPGIELSPGFRMPGLDDPGMVRTVYTAGITMAYLLTMVVGVLTIGGEYRHKTITGTFLATPRRSRVMVAKIVSLLGIGVLY